MPHIGSSSRQAVFSSTPKVCRRARNATASSGPVGRARAAPAAGVGAAPSVGKARALGAAGVATIAAGVAATVTALGLIAPGELALVPAPRGVALAAGGVAAGGVTRVALAPVAGAEAGPAAASEVGAAIWRQPP